MSGASSGAPVVFGERSVSIVSAVGVVPLMGAAALAAGVLAGNINAAPAPGAARMALSDASRTAADANTHLLLRLEAQRRMRTVGAPTADPAVRLALRERRQPITLFGEGPPERRARLQLLMAEADVVASVAAQGIGAVVAAATAAAGGDGAAKAAFLKLAHFSATATATAASAAALAASAPPKAELFYTPASDDLVEARRVIAADSFERAAKRLEMERQRGSEANWGVQATCVVGASVGTTSASASATSSAHHRDASAARSQASLVADERPLSTIAIASDGSLVAVGSWGPLVRLIDAGSARVVATLRGHGDRVCSLAWAPGAGVGRLHMEGQAVCRSLPIADEPPAGATHALLASASSDGTAKLWRLSIDAVREGGASASASASASSLHFTPTATLSGHAGRLACIAWHPTGRYVGTTGFDRTWRLWDVERSSEIMLQEGHAKEAYAIAFHTDGALVATGDLGGLGLVWDLRSGKSIFLLRGHAKALLSLDWSPNGRLIASASEDGTSCVWDIRQQRLVYAIPAHTAIVSKVRFEQTSGDIFATASFDGSSKLWSSLDFSPLRTLPGEAKVTGLDIFNTRQGKGLAIVTANYDRSVKIWAADVVLSQGDGGAGGGGGGGGEGMVLES